MRGFVLPTLLTASLVALGAGDRVQIVAGVKLVVPASDGTLYLLGNGTVQPTPGAYLRTKPGTGSSYFLERYDPGRDRILYATYLNFDAYRLEVDQKGAAYIFGWTYDANFSITPGAYDGHITGREKYVIAKLNPAGSAMDYVTVLGGSSSYSSPRSGDIAVAPDGSAFVTGLTASADFPVTADAFQRLKPAVSYDSAAFLAQLSADGSRLVYSTFLGGSRDTWGNSIWIDQAGLVHVAGTTQAADFPTTPGTFTTPIKHDFINRAFVARFDPMGHRFGSLTAFGSDFRAAVFAHNRKGRVAIFGFPNDDEFDATAGAMWPVWWGAGLIVLDERTDQPLTMTGLPVGASVTGLGLDEDGAITVVGSGAGIPVSTTARQRSSNSGEYIMKLDAAARRLIFGTYYDSQPAAVQAARVTPGAIYVAMASPSTLPPVIYAPFDTVTAPLIAGQCSSIYAIPNVIQRCGNRLPWEPWPELFWDACDASLGYVAVGDNSSGSVGRLTATSASGSFMLPQDSTTLFRLDAGTSPGFDVRTLGTERFTFEPASRCASVPNPKGRIAFDNPILSCSEAPLTGTKTAILGYISDYTGWNAPLEIRYADEARQVVIEAIGGQSHRIPEGVEEMIKATLGEFVYGRTGRRPMILPVVMRV